MIRKALFASILFSQIIHPQNALSEIKKDESKVYGKVMDSCLEITNFLSNHKSAFVPFLYRDEKKKMLDNLLLSMKNEGYSNFRIEKKIFGRSFYFDSDSHKFELYMSINDMFSFSCDKLEKSLESIIHAPIGQSEHNGIDIYKSAK